MDYAEVKLWFDVAQFLLTGAVGVYVWISSRQRVTRERIDELERHINTRLEKHAVRLTAVEKDIQHAPTDSHIAELHERINPLRASLEGLSATVTAQGNTLNSINATMHRIEEYLLNEAHGGGRRG